MAHLAAWDAGRALGDNTRNAVKSSSALAVVVVEGNRASDYVAGGAAVERLWLEAERAQLAVQPVSPIFIYATERADFEALVGDAAAPVLAALAGHFRHIVGVAEPEQLVLVLRLSHAQPPSARSLRQPLDQVLERFDQRNRPWRPARRSAGLISG
jgi:hypothetical protein